jgi:hypothetical protein
MSLLSLATCGGSPTEVALNEEFELLLGQSVRVAGRSTVLTFERVREDSRCPVDVTCVWAGNAVVVLRVGGDHPSTAVELNTTLEPKHAAVDDVELELRSLEPSPRSGETVSDRTYRARLRFVSP